MDKEWGQQGQQVTIAITAPSPNLPHCYISIIQVHNSNTITADVADLRPFAVYA
jgi:hypothetical protein